MAEYLLDANHLSTLVSTGHDLRDRFFKQTRLGDTFAVATPALAEMLYGIRMIPHAAQNVQEWNKISMMFLYHTIETIDAERAAILQVVMSSNGWQLKTVDALMAAVALRHSLTLLTTDGDFSAIPDLHCENWLA